MNDALAAFLFGCSFGALVMGLLLTGVNNNNDCAKAYGFATKEYALCKYAKSYGDKP